MSELRPSRLGVGRRLTGGSASSVAVTRISHSSSCSGGTSPQGLSGMSMNAASNPVAGTLGLEVEAVVDHVDKLSEDIGRLFEDAIDTDVELLVEGKRFPCHRVILASRSDYFKALLYGGLRESTEKVVGLQDTPLQAFEILIRYVYRGRVDLTNLKEETLISLLGVANRYGFPQLEAAISSYLQSLLSLDNVCSVYDAASLFDLSELQQFCLTYMDRHANEVLQLPAFLQLSRTSIRDILTRDSFYAPEKTLFEAVRRWHSANPDEESSLQFVLSTIRLQLMPLNDLLHVVRPSGLVPAERLLDAIEKQMAGKSCDLPYRGKLLHDVNVATHIYGAEVQSGEMRHELLNGDNVTYDLDRGFARHSLDDVKTEGIVVKLCNPFLLNHIKLHLWDKDARSYSYIIETSVDRQDWSKVIDYSAHYCQSFQYLFFPPRVVQYIRVKGTNNTVNRVFHLVSLEAVYATETEEIRDGFVVPRFNVATIERRAAVIEGVSRSRNALLNGDTENYDWDSGYTCHQLGTGAIIVQLNQPYILDSMRLLLWDCDARHYSYYVEVSTNQREWEMVVDHRGELRRSWQTIFFAPRPVVFIRIIGTHNTANEVFHCVHFECPVSEEHRGSSESLDLKLEAEAGAGDSDPLSVDNLLT